MKIKISHLKDGFHTIEIHEKPESFDLKGSENYKTEIDVVLEIDKQRDTLYIKERVTAMGDFVCDRCAESFQRQVVTREQVVYTSDRELVRFDEELRYLAPDQQEIDITDDIRDALLLAIPIKVLCSEACKGICPRCGRNLNVETCHCRQERIDPRWEALRRLGLG